MTLGEDIVDHKKFNEIATISHSGNLARGHYTYFIKSASSSSSSWFHCNDAAVTPSNETALNNDTYIFFYKNMSWEYEKIGRGELWVSECWSLQEFCIPALCISAGIFLTCTLAWIFKGTSHHWWPSSTSLEVTPLVTQGNSCQVLGAETAVVQIYYLYQMFGKGVTTPLMIQVIFSKGD